MYLRTLGKLCVAGLIVSVLAACGSGSGSGSSSQQESNTISIFGLDGPLAGADVAVYGLQAYIDASPDLPGNLLAVPATTDPVTALADDLELVSNAGLGPFVVVVTANATTVDLSTAALPVIDKVKTIVELLSLTGERVYATPLTTIATELVLASSGEITVENLPEKLADAQSNAKAFFGFGMDTDIDIFTTSPILDEASTDSESQDKVAEYRGANEALAAVIEGLNELDEFGISDLLGGISDSILNDDTIINAIQAFELTDITSRLAAPGINTIAGLLGSDATSLATYAIDPSVVYAPTNTLDSDNDTVNNADDAFPSDPTETTDSDLDGVGDNEDVFPDDPTETVDSDGDGVGDNADAFPANPNETVDTDGDGVGDNADAFPSDPSETVDTDGDSVGDNADNCPATSNQDQLDTDTDGAGNACDAFPNDADNDIDGDGIGGDVDNCPANANPDQLDTDNDGLGDVCDTDADNDGVSNDDDAFPNDPAESVDSDGDSVGDNGDNCPANANPDQLDTDNDGPGDACDTDADNDGVSNDDDAFPNDPTETVDTDGDGVGDNSDNCPNIANALQSNADDDAQGDACDTDADNDGVSNDDDAFPNDPAETVDTDGDTVGDNGDNCPNVANPVQKDLDIDEQGDACDDDIDGDGALNADDAFSNDPNEQLDSDGDLVGDNADAFPNDPTETVDTDGDTVGDNGDNCPTIANPEQADADSNDLGDACDAGDLDDDGVFSDDNCPLIPNSDQLDTDNDGFGDACDNCPTDDNPNQTDTDNNGVGNVCEAIITARPIHFDFFYNQLSSESGEFKAAVVGETVTQSDGTIEVGVGVDSTVLDFVDEVDGLSSGSFDVRADYAATEESLSYSGTNFSGVAPGSVVTLIATDVRVSDNALTYIASEFQDVLSVGSTTFSAWGDNNFIGSGRVTLNGASSTLATAQEQALSLLSYADGNSDDADLNADYGVVLLDTVYGDDDENSVIGELSNLVSVVGVFNFDNGALALSGGSEYESSLGLTAGSVGFSTEPASTGTYTVSPTGAVELVVDGESNFGFADMEGDLFTLVDPNRRVYGVKLGAGNISADLANKAFELKGLVIESSNKRLGASTYEGLTAEFSADGSVLTLAGTIDQALAPFSVESLPTVSSNEAPFDLASNPITIADNGRLSPITFANSGLELEGFVAENGGLLLRVVEMETIVIAGTPAGLQVDDPDGNGPLEAAFFPVTGPVFNNITPTGVEEGDFYTVLTSEGQFLAGTWVAASGSETTSAITSDVRSGSGPDFGSIAEGTTVTISQGVLFGFPPSFTVIPDVNPQP